jgi:hypothetical protein
MNRSVYVFVTATIIVSVLNGAHAESMVERKQRIMRKYMRERQDIVQSDLGLSAAVEEDARVVESERFKELSPNFERQKGVTMPRVIQPNQPVPVQSERNWWLETAEMDTDSFANPFSSRTDAEEGSTSSWSPWGRREDSSIYGNAYGQQRDGQDETYSGRREDSSVYGDAYGQQREGRRGDTYPGAWSAYGMPGESGNRSSGSGMTYGGYTTRRAPASRENDRSSGFYGRQQTEPRGTGGAWGINSGGRYGSAPSSGLPQSPFPPSSTAQDWNSQNQIPGYTPYRSPYQDQGGEQRRSGSNLQPQQPQYSRPNNYQKWKDNNKAFDPTSDNSYLDELMRNQRR